MNFNYATLQNYNEVYDNSDLSDYTPQYNYDMKNVTVYQALLSGDILEPIIETDASGSMVLVLDADLNGFHANVSVRQLSDPVECVLSLVNDKDIVEKSIKILWNKGLSNKISGTLFSTFFSLNSIGLSVDQFYKLLTSQRVLVTIKTKSQPLGEVDGILVKIY